MATDTSGSGEHTAMTVPRDRIYAEPQLSIAGFRFDDQVVAVFPDMIQRSVPGYETIVAMTGTLAERYLQPDTRCYDLGCSLGASLLSVRAAVEDRPCTLVGVDNSPAMVERCRELIAAQPAGAPTTIHCADITEFPLENATLVVLNFTLQFVAREQRDNLLQRISDALQPGGILVLSEKVCFDDDAHNRLMVDLHHHFKRAQGYSDLEIAQKRSALENVLVPETLDAHRTRLRRVGFSSVDVWFQCFNFASLIAIK